MLFHKSLHFPIPRRTTKFCYRNRSSISKAVDSENDVTETEDVMPYEEHQEPRISDVKLKVPKRRRPYFPGDKLFLRVPASSRSPDHGYSSDSSNPSDDQNPFVTGRNFYKFKKIKKNLTQTQLSSPIAVKKTFVPTLRFSPWPSISPDYLYWVNTDGYFRENENIAEHGLVVRDHLGNPITARSWFTEKPISLLYHQLKGVLEAYRVAKELGIKRLQVVCNHSWTHDVLERFHYPGRSSCLDNPQNNAYARKHICKICVKGFFSQHFPLFWPIFKDIAALVAKFIGYKSLVIPIFRHDNQIADYMAKYGKRYGREVVLRPTEFSQELKTLLYQLAEALPDNGVPIYAPPGGFL